MSLQSLSRSLENSHKAANLVIRVVQRCRRNANDTRTPDVAHDAPAHNASQGDGVTDSSKMKPAFECVEHGLCAAVDEYTDLQKNKVDVAAKTNGKCSS